MGVPSVSSDSRTVNVCLRLSPLLDDHVALIGPAHLGYVPAVRSRYLLRMMPGHIHWVVTTAEIKICSADFCSVL